MESRKLIKKYLLTEPQGHFFNDLTVNSKGDVFITDSTGGNVYTINTGKDQLQLLSQGYVYPNGITISHDDNHLFFAHYTGIYKMNLQTKETIRLSHGADNTLVFIDGLTFYKNSLIAHQQTSLGGIYRHYLNPFRDEVLSRDAVELYNPLFNFTTTGEISGDTYYYLANAQFRNYNKDGSLFPYDKLSDVYILKTTLKDKAK